MTENTFNVASNLIDTIRNAKKVVVLTGAGMSVECGVPTYRDSQKGLWRKFRPEELATPQAFRTDPHLVWEWYCGRREVIQQAIPHAGYSALEIIEQHAKQFTIITQNIDGLHQKAGSRSIIELHGNIHRARCIAEDITFAEWDDSNLPPKCPNCHTDLRPDVVWFGEPIPASSLEAAITASRTCDLFFSIGTSGLIEPASTFPYEALRHGAEVIEINPLATPLTVYATYYLPYPAGVLLPSLVEAAWPAPQS
jgi:NAD-dependent deacetylase